MPRIKIETEIKGDITIVFDLSRSIDLHKISTEQTNETAIAGKTSGLIGMDESVTWRAKHFGVYQNLTSKITAYDRPNSFTDEMVKGAFKKFKHEHIFSESNGKTLMVDIFDYKSPLGILGKLADKIFLKKYMTDLLTERNRVVKEFAESDKWKAVLTESVSLIDTPIKRTEKCHFWIGRFESEDLYFDFLGEDNSCYESEEEDIPLSKFIASQGETWVDHDFMESGFEPPQPSLQQQFEKYSYAYNWGPELEKKCTALKLEQINTLVFLNEDQIEKPVSVKGAGFELTYIGVIEYEI